MNNVSGLNILIIMEMI